MQRRKRYLYDTDVIPSRTLRRIRSRQRQLSRATTTQVSLRNDVLSTTDKGESMSVYEESSSVEPAILRLSESAEEMSISESCEEETQAKLERTDSGIVPSSSSEDDDDTSSESSSSDSSQDSDYSQDLPQSNSIESRIYDDARKEDVDAQSWLLVQEHEEDLQVPLSETTSTTRGDALLMCLAFGLRHNLSWKGMEDLLQMINSLFGQEVVKATKYFLQKYMNAGKGKMVYHMYCPYCQRYLGNKETFLDANLGCPCGQTLKDINDASSFFLSLDLGEQIRNLLRDKLFVGALRYRFERRKISEDNYEDIYDGKLYKKLNRHGQILSRWYNMSYMFNTDGFPVGGKSGKQTCWPIYVQINELPPKLRSKFMLLAGIYVGKKDPNMNIFMYPFVEEANFLSTTGINWYLDGKKINSKIIPLCACVDTPARHKILNTTAFNGRYGCSLCYTIPEAFAGGKGYRYPIPIECVRERTHEEILIDASKAHANRSLIRNKSKRRVRGVKGPSPLHNLLYFDLVKGVRPDTMHSILLGNARHFVSVLHDSTGKSYYIGSDVRMKVISDRLLSIKPPSSLMRNPRDFNSFTSWQAKEWRSWLLFYAVPCLLHIIPIEYVNLLNILSSAVHIILSKSISERNLDTFHILILRYVFLFQQYFGKEEMVINIHLLLHLKKSIEYLGPAWTNVAFSFEGANKSLLELKKGASTIAQEIANKYLTFQSLPLLCQKYASSENTINFCQNLSGRPLLKNAHRMGEVVLLGKGKQICLDFEERQCLLDLTFDGGMESYGNMCMFDKFIMGGIRYCAAPHNRSTKTDDSYISIRGESKARIKKIIECADIEHSIYLLVRELILDDAPVFNDEFGKHSPLKRKLGHGRLLAIRPSDISGQCVAMSVESGDFICDVPYGCYSDS